jgi:diguanylate cyclase (GGDEF)-like protein/PAS domain S-box-containing protein
MLLVQKNAGTEAGRGASGTPAPSRVTQFVLAQEALGICTWIWDVERGSIEWFGDPSSMLGLAPHGFGGHFGEYLALLHAEDRARSRATLVECLKGVRPTYRNEERIVMPDGSVRWLEAYGRGRYADDGRALEIAGVVRDVTERKEADARIEFLANHDALTTLPNRSLLLDRVSHALASARRESPLAVLLLGLDRFKNVNDSLGHHVGDRLLKSVAARLQSVLAKGDTVARMGGDEFAILLEDLDSPAAAACVAQKIQTALSEPFVIEGHHIAVAASVGISVPPSDGSTAEALLTSASVAMHHAKELGRNNYQYFSRELNARAIARARLELDLRRAVLGGELYLEFQPVYAAQAGRPVGAEALLRWRHAERGQVPPAEFIPVAERIGIISQIGDWVLERALGQLAQWHAAGWRELTMAVNVSPRQLSQGQAFVARVAQLLAAHGLPAGCLELEITENTFAREIEEVPAALAKLSSSGVRISIDDFGTGYSSIYYLQRLRFDSLKIDHSFVSQIERSENDAVLTRTIIAMARSLGLQVVAEGVETQGQLEFLRGLKCDFYQGYFLSRPLSGAEFGRRLLEV